MALTPENAPCWHETRRPREICIDGAVICNFPSDDWCWKHCCQTDSNPQHMMSYIKARAHLGASAISCHMRLMGVL